MPFLPLRLASIALVASAVAACSTYTAPRYAVSVGNVVALRTFRGQTIAVGQFTSPDGRREIGCRASGPVEPPDGDSFAAYVRRALVSELAMAEVFATDAPVTLTGSLDRVELSSTDAEWQLALTVTSSNGKQLQAEERYHFEPSFVGVSACNQSAQALVPAVQDLIAKVVHDPRFKELVAQPSAPPPHAAVL